MQGFEEAVEHCGKIGQTITEAREQTAYIAEFIESFNSVMNSSTSNHSFQFHEELSAILQAAQEKIDELIGCMATIRDH